MSAAIRAIRAAILHPADLEDLSRSIRQHGIVQPVMVRSPVTAATKSSPVNAAGVPLKWPAWWKFRSSCAMSTTKRRSKSLLSKMSSVRISIALEEAQGYEQLIAQYGYTQNDLGEVIGKSRSHVANSLAPAEIAGRSPADAGRRRPVCRPCPRHRIHFRSGRPGAKDRRAKVFRFVTPKSSHSGMPSRVPVRQGLKSKSANRPEEKDADTLALERSLSDVLGLKVQLAHKGQGGQLRIDYKSLEQLDELCRLLGEK
jgi:ParB family chromosome partitioning protein